MRKFIYTITINKKKYDVFKEGPTFLFAYDKDGNRCGYGEYIDEVIAKIPEAEEWNKLSKEEKQIRNAMTAYKMGHMD